LKTFIAIAKYYLVRCKEALIQFNYVIASNNQTLLLWTKWAKQWRQILIWELLPFG